MINDPMVLPFGILQMRKAEQSNSKRIYIEFVYTPFQGEQAVLKQVSLEVPDPNESEETVTVSQSYHKGGTFNLQLRDDHFQTMMHGVNEPTPGNFLKPGDPGYVNLWEPPYIKVHSESVHVIRGRGPVLTVDTDRHPHYKKLKPGSIIKWEDEFWEIVSVELAGGLELSPIRGLVIKEANYE